MIPRAENPALFTQNTDNEDNRLEQTQRQIIQNHIQQKLLHDVRLDIRNNSETKSRASTDSLLLSFIFILSFTHCSDALSVNDGDSLFHYINLLKIKSDSINQRFCLRCRLLQ